MKMCDIQKDYLFRQGRGPKVDTVIFCPERDLRRKFYDAEKLAVAKGWAQKYYDGLWYYSGEAVALFNYFRTEIKRIASSLDFQEWIFPRLISEETAKDFGLIEAWPYYLLRVQPLVNHSDSTITQDGEKFLLDPVQCAPLYAFFSNREIKADELPIKVVESNGFTYRDERKEALLGFRKTVEFLRTEMVFIGTPKQVKKIREDISDKTIKFLGNLDIDWRIVVGSGCYETPTEEDIAYYEKATCTNEIPIYDFEVYDPFWQGEKWLEIAGCSMLRDRKTKAYRMKCENGVSLWSGCVGFGLNRLVYSFLLYHGVDKKKWPDIVKQGLNSIQKFYEYKG